MFAVSLLAGYNDGVGSVGGSAVHDFLREFRMFLNDLVETTDIFGLTTYVKNGLSLTVNNLKVRIIPGKEISIAKVKFR